MSTEGWIYTMNSVGGVGAWSRYTFPWRVEATALLGETLYLRAGNSVYRVSEDATTDAGTAIVGTVQWPWLDFGVPSVTKRLEGIDVVGTGTQPSVQVGYDQRAIESFTPGYTIPADTLPGMVIPLPVAAPSLSMRLTYNGGAWSLQSVTLYLHDNRRGA